MTVLSLRDVTVRLPGRERPLLDGISLALEAGERVALTGLNGSGKTTLLSTIACLFPCSGEVRVEGMKLTPRSAPKIRERLGYLFNVPEDQLLFPRVLDDVAYGLVRRGVAMKEAHDAARWMLARLGMEDRASGSVHELSHGQKQRVALAGALVTGAPLLLLDEPSAALDPVAKVRLAELLASLEGTTILCATNDIPFARALCGRYLLLEEGRLVSGITDEAAIMARWGLTR